MKQFIQQLSHITWSDLSEETINAGKKVLLDTVGAMIAGAKESTTEDLMHQLKIENSGYYTVVGSDQTFNLYTAGLINGTATVAIEIDEGNQWSKGHPAAHVVPTSLTYVQTKEKFSGQDFIVELIKAYEICSRFGRATKLLPDAHAHGTWGVMGAAASALLLEDISSEQLYKGLNMSASFTMATMWSAALEGALIRNIYVGQAVESGIKTVDLLKSSFLAPENSIAYVYGEVVGQEFDADSFDNFDKKWDVERNYYKEHAFCRYAHTPLDAFKIIVNENYIHSQDIEKIDVWTYSRAATLNSSEYHNALSAKFSIPYALSAWIHTGKSDHSVFNQEYLESSNIRDLARLVNVSVSKELEKDYPTIMPAELVVKLYSGNIYRQRLNHADTGLGEDVSFKYLINKFKVNTPHLSEKRQNEIVDWINQIDQKDNMEELIGLLSKKEV